MSAGTLFKPNKRPQWRPTHQYRERARADSKLFCPTGWLTRQATCGLSLACCAAVLMAAPSAAADQPPQAASQPTAHVPVMSGTGDCLRCHFCDRPTPTDKCLRLCTRPKAGRQQESSAPDNLGPDLVILDNLDGDYLPVPFDHKGHASMAEMGEGCATCHHFTPEGQQPPPCQTCHDVSAAGTDIHKPGLKGAYHQQCLNCHREWIDETDCDVCHRPKAGRQAAGAASPSPTKDDFLGRRHPPIPEPDTDFYRGHSTETSDTKVVFRHQEHVSRFELKCVDCHHERSCARCHVREQDQPRTRTMAEHHRTCIKCHKDDMDLAARKEGRCESCHWREGQPKPKSFDHATTGWALAGYHQRAGCRDCHATVPFAKLDRNCESCHGQWEPSTFDHRVTGQVLDENHAEIDCADCHHDKYDQPPSCDECHEEEITFPAKRPGQFVGS